MRLLRELGWLGLAAGLLGLILSKGTGTPFGIILMPAFLISGPLFFMLSNLPVREESSLPILEPYLLMTNLFILPWLALGFEKVIPRFRSISIGILAVLILWFAPRASHRKDFIAYDFGKNILRSMPLHSSFFEPDDASAFVLSYFQTVEKKREDISILLTLRTKWGYDEIMRRYPDLLPGMSFPNAPDANQYLTREYRAGWAV